MNEPRSHIEQKALDKELISAIKTNPKDVRRLLEKGANPNARTSARSKCAAILLVGARQKKKIPSEDRMDAWKALFDHPDFDMRETVHLINEISFTMQHKTSKPEDYDEMKFLLDKGVPCLESNVQRMAMAGATHYLIAMLDHGFSASSESAEMRWGKSSALSVAVQNNHTDAAIALIEAGANVNYQEYLDLDRFPGINGKPPEYSETAKWTPLHWAVRRSNVAVVEHLLLNGADPKIKSLAGETPSDLPYVRAAVIDDMIAASISKKEAGELISKHLKTGKSAKTIKSL